MNANSFDPLAPVTLDEYRAIIDKQGAAVRRTTSRLRNERQILKDSVLRALAAGMSEVEASKLSGMARVTVREWAGK